MRASFVGAILSAGIFVGACGESGPGSAAPASAPPRLAATPTPASTAPVLSPNAPRDQPITSQGNALADQRRAIAPYIEQGRRSYPQAKQRYLEGLPTGEHFFVTTTLHSAGAEETVFVAVSRIEGAQITGTIANDLQTVKGYRNGDPYTFAEAELVDWLIAKPDGSEEGNVVGKFLDEWSASHR